MESPTHLKQIVFGGAEASVLGGWRRSFRPVGRRLWLPGGSRLVPGDRHIALGEIGANHGRTDDVSLLGDHLSIEQKDEPVGFLVHADAAQCLAAEDLFLEILIFALILEQWVILSFECPCHSDLRTPWTRIKDHHRTVGAAPFEEGGVIGFSFVHEAENAHCQDQGGKEENSKTELVPMKIDPSRICANEVRVLCRFCEQVPPGPDNCHKKDYGNDHTPTERFRISFEGAQEPENCECRCHRDPEGSEPFVIL